LLAADSGIIVANDALTLRFSTRWNVCKTTG
jgi:hypothetical protein